MSAIFRREMLAYFQSAIGYVFLAVVYVFSGFFFWMVDIYGQTSSMSGLFSSIILIYIFLVPVLTMRLFSEEKRTRTDQLLLTAPVSLEGVVGGKFIAAMCVYGLSVAIMGVYALVLAAFSTVDTWVIVGNIVGLLLVGAALIAIGIFISNLTENQVIAAVASIFVMLMLYLVDSISSVFSNQFLATLLTSISVYSRFNNFSLGVFNLGDAVFFLSVAFGFLFLTVRMLEKRRWS